MSSSATHSGTTPAVGGSGRGLGFAAVVLAVVIAAGVVVSVNQGNDTATDVNAQINTRAAQAESDRLNAMADYAFRNDPENLPSELKRIYEMIATAEANSDPRHIVERQMAYTSAATKANNDPRQVIERQMAQSSGAESASSGSGVLQERLAHEFLEDQRTPQSQGNPLERIAR